MISQVCPELPGVYGLAGGIVRRGAAMSSSLPWAVLQFPGAGGGHFGSRESCSASALVSSEGAQTELSNSQTPGKYLLDDAFGENKY